MNSQQIQELDDLKYEALKTILELMPRDAANDRGLNGLRLAEAYAWLMYPNQPHGGGAAAPKTT